MAFLKKKGNRFVIIIGLCASIYLYLSYHNNTVSTHPEKSHYPQQSTIENQLKIDIQPLSLTASQPTTFHIHIESFQNTELSQINLIESSLMTHENKTPFRPTHWEPLSQDTHHQTGILTFPPLSRSTQKVSVTIFEYTDRTFNWTISTQNNHHQN